VGWNLFGRRNAARIAADFEAAIDSEHPPVTRGTTPQPVTFSPVPYFVNVLVVKLLRRFPGLMLPVLRWQRALFAGMPDADEARDGATACDTLIRIADDSPSQLAQLISRQDQ
jgi:hypothetical protein